MLFTYFKHKSFIRNCIVNFFSFSVWIVYAFSYWWLKKNWNIVDLHYHVSFRCTAEWFSYVNGVFWWKGNFDFDENQFISFFPCMFGAFVTWKKSSPTPRSWRFSPIFSSRRCWGFCLCPWPIQDLFLCRTKSWGSIFFPYHIQLSQCHLLKIFSLPVDLTWNRSWKVS